VYCVAAMLPTSGSAMKGGQRQQGVRQHYSVLTGIATGEKGEHGEAHLGDDQGQAAVVQNVEADDDQADDVVRTAGEERVAVWPTRVVASAKTAYAVSEWPGIFLRKSPNERTCQ